MTLSNRPKLEQHRIRPTVTIVRLKMSGECAPISVVLRNYTVDFNLNHSLMIENIIIVENNPGIISTFKNKINQPFR